MSILPEIWAKIKNQFSVLTLGEYDSPVNGHITVRQAFGDRYIYANTSQVTQSGGIVKDLWPPVFSELHKRFGLKNKKWLILGVAGGTVFRQISQRYSPSAMVGVEIDPVMVEIGRKFFGLDRIPNLSIIVADAKAFVSALKSDYDFILVDMYLGDVWPDFIRQPAFISRLHRHAPVVVFNHLYYTQEQISQATRFSQTLTKYFTTVQPVRSLANLLLICS